MGPTVPEGRSDDGRVLTILVERLAPEPTVRCEGWCTAEKAVLILPMPDGDNQTLSVPVSEIVVRLAALVGLGPRPRATAEAPPSTTARLHWRVGTQWHGPGGAAKTRTVSALDGGDAGWWLIGGEGTDPEPTTATQLFRRLCRLLPTDAELG